ncbi:Fructose dehydrogenase large subunit [Frondihabitans sp. 762G35]|uniref:GMC family oxidoreductase n=1 Tax=Frondihabitans sp. 762G35 TaxID=1446794 RepID=UPI000D212011|nr:GMC family oxidoreductase [Frondihabitans sp. 762G35]ARC55549.1 Fructose dehydrogenase large subunit [Frondihabitans sp. 762G35]
MNLDSMRSFGDDDVVDVVVIGTGAGGAPLLADLAGRGFRVVALEAGRNFDPQAFTQDETEATEIIWLEERLSDGADPTAFGANNSGQGVGGSMLHWGAFTPRPDPRDLRLRSTQGAGEDWPIEHDELTRYLERVERFVGVSGPADYPWDPARSYEMPPPARNASSDMMIRGCEARGIRATDAPAAVLTRDRHQDHVGTRPACANCGSCHQGCRSGAKVSMDTTYLPLAIASGAEIRPGSRVHGFEQDASGRVTAVLYLRDGVERRQRCRTVVLSAGGIETPRLLLHAGIANSSDQVGRNFMVHGATQVWGRFEEEMRSYRGYPSSIITEDFVRPDDADFVGGYLIQSLGAMPLTLATTMARSAGLWGQELVSALLSYRHLAGVGINAECLPDERNRLTLSDELDAHGMPKAHIAYTAGENEQRLEQHAIRTMTGIVEAAGATETMVLNRTAHTIGTARMGTDPARAVVDPDGRSHDVPNLWVSDNSTFPSSVIANPALTIMALSLRTAERIAASA